MGIALLSFFAIFLLVASGGVLLFYREIMLKRISEAISPRKKKKDLATAVKQGKSSVANFMERFDNLMPKSEKEVSVAVQRLTLAGYRNESAVRVFYGSKVLTPVLLACALFFSGLISRGTVIPYLAALALGYLAPDFWLGKMITARQKRISKGLPDVLDLLVICMEAGLSLDQATARAAQELSKSHPDLCDELNVVVLEQHAGCPRSDAWKHMGDRTGVESLRNLVSTLVQTEQFGTSIAKVFRVHADTLRTQRIQTIEELAAKTSVKLVFPLVFFVFPALFLVTLGPAAITMMEAFSKLTK